MTPIFSEHCWSYWERGLPAIPLWFHDKKPIIPAWSRFAEMMPSQEEMTAWAMKYPDNNIGLALGPQSGLTMIDIDTEDEDLIAAILAIVPPSPWKRKGRKGMMLAYRFSGLPTFRIKDKSGKMLVECLSSTTQIVLPPSIHPETKLPYEANCNLWEVLDQLAPLHAETETKLRTMFEQKGVELSQSGWTRLTDFVSPGSRDVKMTAVAGLFASGVVRGEMTCVEAIERMRAWHQACVEKIAGDDIDIEKGVNNLIKFLVRDVIDKEKVLPMGWDAGLTEEMKANMGLVFTIDNEQWDYERMRNYLKGEFEKYDPDTQGRMNAIEMVMKKIASSEVVGPLDAERIMKYIVDVGGMHLTVGNLRRRVNELKKGDLEGLNHAEIAEDLKKDLESLTPHAFVNDNFWIYNGSNWEILPKPDLLRKVAENYGHMQAAKKAADHGGILKVLSALLPQQLGSDPIKGVNFANGVLLEDGTMMQHNPIFGFTYTLPYRYLPGIGDEARKWTNFLTRCWGDEPDFQERLACLQEVICTTMFGKGPDFQVAVLLYGVAHTGKTQMLTILENLLPSEAKSSVPPDTWTDKFAPTAMMGKILNVCGELSERRLIDGQAFKSIIDGERRIGQYKGGQLFEFNPICMNWFASNFLPKSDDGSQGFNRRWIILSFNSPVRPEEKVLNFGQLVANEEREAIVSWALEAMPRLRARPVYTLPSSHKALIEEVAAGNNSVRFFLTKGPVRLEEGNLVGVKEIYSAYWSFCLSEGGLKPSAPSIFVRRMRELAVEMGFQEVPTGYLGLKVDKK